ncbi:site-specific integrase [uncultured Maribacter sp.]|uniref:tyrosine-type recombinase/integrase n=1 Tax=uncultured Maribacter sp. TaxID=431308 RepID=UPI0026234EF1|nr:site-specific integrase [uncultured Maribacter sp.]
MELKILRVKLSDGSYIPIMFNDHIPYYIVFKYSILGIKYKSYKSQYNYLLDIKKFIEFLHKKNINLEKEILNNNPIEILHSINNLLSWKITLKSRTKKTKKNSQNHLFNFDQFLINIHKFLVWCITNYCDSSYIEILNNIISVNKLNIKRNSQYTSLKENQIEQLYELISHSNSLNPFISNNRLRNYIIVKILIETGIRLSELLNLKTDDFIRDNGLVYLQIIERLNDSQETRKNKPLLKNDLGQRIVAVSPELYLLIDKYIIRFRKKNKSNSFLLTNYSNGKPLSKSSISNLFKTLSQRLEFTITPHQFRHYFAERMLNFLLEKKGIDMDRAKDELRIICGWSLNSRMPNLYAKNYIALLANQHNMDRIKTKYEDV